MAGDVTTGAACNCTLILPRAVTGQSARVLTFLYSLAARSSLGCAGG